MALLRYLISIIFCNIYRILRIFPNNDPIMGFMLPYARKDKWWQALIFPLIAIISFDILTNKVGVWTIGTAVTYGVLGLFFQNIFRKIKTMSLKKYAASSIFGVLFFDFVTGPIMSSWLFGISFFQAFMGQIPFTMMHLASATAFTLLVVPVLDPQITKSVKMSFASYLNRTKLIIAIVSGGRL